MTWGMTMHVPAPIEMYDAVHAELLQAAGRSVDGLLLHVARPADGGFEVIEVWESREQFEHYDAELVGPVVARLSGGRATGPGEQPRQEFEVRGLVIPAADIWR